MPISPDDPRLQKCGFAKLSGDGVEYYMRKYEVIIGRRSKSASLDVVLGDNMNISREHAKIIYNFETRNFELTVMGKNGVTVNKTLHTPSSPPAILQSQDFVSVGDRSFYFLLPKDISKFASKRKRAPAGFGPSKLQAAGASKPAKPAAPRQRSANPALPQKPPVNTTYAQTAPKVQGTAAAAAAAARTQYEYSAPYQGYTSEEPAEAYEGEDEEPAEADEGQQYEQEEEVAEEYGQEDEQEYVEGEQNYTEGEQDYAEPYEGEDEEQGQEQPEGDGYDEDENGQEGQQVQEGYADQRGYATYAGGTYYAGNGAYH